MKRYNLDGYTFVAPAVRKDKKYSVYDSKTGKYITSFGSIFYQQYKDKIGHYRELDHNDKQRRVSYYQRHGKRAKKDSAKYFSHKYLW